MNETRFKDNDRVLAKFRVIVERLAKIDKKALDLDLDLEKSTKAIFNHFVESKGAPITTDIWDKIKVLKELEK